MTLGAFAGALGHGVSVALPERVVQALLSWSLAAALGVAALRSFRASRAPSRGVSSTSAPMSLGRGPRRASLTTRLLARVLDAPLALGVLTALLPCGALATGLLIAAGSGAAHGGGLAMAGFALASGPALALASFALERVRHEAGRGGLRLAALALALGAAALVLRPVAGLRGDDVAPCHAPVR